MRLVNVRTLKLESFFHNVPPYAILSHTWEEGQEVTFQMMMEAADGATQRDPVRGWDKIENGCKQAAYHGWGYAWIDTCCIDKTNSAELSEAINSMYRWYEEAAVCYVHLADVHRAVTAFEPPLCVARADGDERPPFHRSRWFTRGWTLQELLAPRFLVFYTASWAQLGTRTSLLDTISDITGIDRRYLVDRSQIQTASAAEIFSWAATRKTQRIEDRAYSLLGLFNIYMPLIYGERTAAFRRLQRQIIQERDDETIFAWLFFEDARDAGLVDLASSPLQLATDRLGAQESLLADSPGPFASTKHIVRWPVDGSRTGFTLANVGFVMRASLYRKKHENAVSRLRQRSTGDKDRVLRLLPLSIANEEDPGTCYALYLRRVPSTADLFQPFAFVSCRWDRAGPGSPIQSGTLAPEGWEVLPSKEIVIRSKLPRTPLPGQPLAGVQTLPVGLAAPAGSITVVAAIRLPGAQPTAEAPGRTASLSHGSGSGPIAMCPGDAVFFVVRLRTAPMPTELDIIGLTVHEAGPVSPRCGIWRLDETCALRDDGALFVRLCRDVLSDLADPDAKLPGSFLGSDRHERWLLERSLGVVVRPQAPDAAQAAAVVGRRGGGDPLRFVVEVAVHEMLIREPRPLELYFSLPVATASRDDLLSGIWVPGIEEGIVQGAAPSE